MPIPANCSLVSARGPSVTITLPSFHRKVLVNLEFCNACPPSSQCPFLHNSSAYAKHSSTSASRSPSATASQAPPELYPKQTNFISSPVASAPLSRPPPLPPSQRLLWPVSRPRH